MYSRDLQNLSWEVAKAVLGQIEPEALHFGRDRIEEVARFPIEGIQLGKGAKAPNKVLKKAASVLNSIRNAIGQAVISLTKGNKLSVIKGPEEIAELVQQHLACESKLADKEAVVSALNRIFREHPSLIDLVLALVLSRPTPECEPLSVLEPGLVKIVDPLGSVSSGFVISDEGHVLTAAHVVGGKANVTVVFRCRMAEGDRREENAQAELHHYDDRHDICVLKIDSESWQRFRELGCRPLPLSLSWAPGNWVLCQGYQEPEIFADPITVEAFIKKWDPIRAVRFRDGFEQECLVLVIPQDYPTVAPGMSGGPVLDLQSCRVIGMVTGATRQAWVRQKWQDEEIWEQVSSARFGFATPLSDVARSWPEFVSMVQDYKEVK